VENLVPKSRKSTSLFAIDRSELRKNISVSANFGAKFSEDISLVAKLRVTFRKNTYFWQITEQNSGRTFDLWPILEEN
jgi:hypothetical protein